MHDLGDDPVTLRWLCTPDGHPYVAMQHAVPAEDCWSEVQAMLLPQLDICVTPLPRFVWHTPLYWCACGMVLWRFPDSVLIFPQLEKYVFSPFTNVKNIV